MIQKKVCMVGVFGTGKTSLVQRYVHSIFSVKYHSTVGVKIDRKLVDLGPSAISLVVWDIEGRSAGQDILASYLRGAHAVFYVADGTRRDTVEELAGLRERTGSIVGDVPSIVALNKVDLQEEWALGPGDPGALAARGWHVLTTSAKTGEGVEEAFRWIANATLNAWAAPGS